MIRSVTLDSILKSILNSRILFGQFLWDTESNGLSLRLHTSLYADSHTTFTDVELANFSAEQVANKVEIMLRETKADLEKLIEQLNQTLDEIG